MDENSPGLFAQKWLGVKDILKSRLAVLKAVSERDERSKLRGELIRCEGRLWLLELLQSGCMQLPIISIEVGGLEIRADRRWNQGLPDPEVRLEGGREPQTVDEERHCGRFCYYCASLTPPVRVQHRMVDCPKRRRANAREYLPEVMAEARAELKRMRHAAEEKLALHRKASEEVRVQKQALLELAGAIKVLGTQEVHKPPPPPPPPPPEGERTRAWKTFLRRRAHQQSLVMKILARHSKVPSALETAPTHWAELKAVALMRPHPRVLAGPITPLWLSHTAATLELNLDTERGDDLNTIPIVIAIARAPLPMPWFANPPKEYRNLSSPTPSAAVQERGSLSWYASPPGVETAYFDKPPPKGIPPRCVVQPPVPQPVATPVEDLGALDIWTLRDHMAGYQKVANGGKRIVDIFRQIDTDRSGELSREEFKTVLKKYGFLHVTDGEISAIVNQIDSDGSGSVRYAELEHLIRGLGSRPPGLGVDAPTTPVKGGGSDDKLVDLGKGGSAFANAQQRHALIQASAPTTTPSAVPVAFTPTRMSGIEVNKPRKRSEAELEAHQKALLEMRRRDRYEHAVTNKRVNGHPGAAVLRPTVDGMKVRRGRASKPSVVSSWVQFVDFEGSIYWYSFVTATRLDDAFPPLEPRDVPVSSFPLRKLEASAQMLADAGAALVHELANAHELRGLPPVAAHELVIADLRARLWVPRRAARALQLAHSPCPLDEVVMAAQYLGLHASSDRELMWLVDVMLSPELPVGWLRRTTVEGTEYYWSAVLGAAQWEHPSISFISGVGLALKSLMHREA